MSTWVVVLAGGRGTRFWPRSRRALPKQCLAIDGTDTLLRQTLDRLAPVVPPDRTLIVTGRDLVERVRALAPELPPDRVLAEPRGRNTAPAIGWAAVEVERRGGDLLIVAPSDHRITASDAYHRALGAATDAARATGALVLIGIDPTGPHPGYGYVVPGEVRGAPGGATVREVGGFVEKPTPEAATALIARGAVWNAGMFVFPVRTLRAAIDRQLPRTGAALGALAAGAPIDVVWDDTDAISIDYGVLERERGLLVVRAAFGWSDLGGWAALDDVLPASPLGVARAAEVVAIDATGNVVDAPDRLVAALGVHGLVIVDTGDVLLVVPKARASEVGRLVAELERRGLGRYT